MMLNEIERKVKKNDSAVKKTCLLHAIIFLMFHFTATFFPMLCAHRSCLSLTTDVHKRGKIITTALMFTSVFIRRLFAFALVYLIRYFHFSFLAWLENNESSLIGVSGISLTNSNARVYQFIFWML